jgi:hypothetical protein
LEQDTPVHKHLALFLLTGEAKGAESSEELQGAVKPTFEKLNAHLSKRFGTAGYTALLKRAVALASADFPWIATLSITRDGDLDGFDALPQQVRLSGTREGCIAILARLIDLVEHIIGRNLCLRVLQGAWPEEIQLYRDRLQGDGDE